MGIVSPEFLYPPPPPYFGSEPRLREPGVEDRNHGPYVKKMYFKPDAFPAEIPSLMKRFIKITGWEPWKKRITTFKDWVRENPLIEEYIAERYAIELAMAHVKRYRDATGRYPTVFESPPIYRLYSFVSMVARVHQRLNDKGRKRVEGILKGCLKDDHGFSWFVAEMVVAGHLMSQKFDVTFSDLETGNGFDFLAKRDEIEIEIECKHVSADVGRKIHRRRLFNLGGVVFGELSHALDQHDGGQFLRVILPDRLTGNHTQLDEILSEVARALRNGADVSGHTSCAVEYKRFDLSNSPFYEASPDSITRGDVQAFLEREYSIQNPHLLMIFRPRYGVIILTVESRQKDTVLRGIIGQLKDSARDQLTGHRPGVMCVYLADIGAEELQNLVASEGPDIDSGTGIQAAATHLLIRRPQVHTLALMGDGPLRRTSARLGDKIQTSWQEHGGVYVIKNPSHPFTNDPRYSIF